MKVNPEAELAAKLALLRFDNKNNARQIAWDAGKLKSLARSHNRLMEAHCNRDLTERETSRVQSIRTFINNLLIPYIGTGKVNFSGDPRGYTVKIHFPDGRGNTWGGDEEGWGDIAMKLTLTLTIVSLLACGCHKRTQVTWRGGLPYCGTEIAGADQDAAERGQPDVAVCPDEKN